MERPNDTRGFLHKSVFGRVVGGVVGGVVGSIPGVSAIKSIIGIGQTLFPGGGSQCPPGSLPNASGTCVQSIQVGGSIPGVTQMPIPGFHPQLPEDIVSPSPGFGRPAGEAVLGIYGAALQPAAEMRQHRICIRGMVLGTDGLCYNRGNLSNKERWWPRGRRPLLTGGEMRAIGIASTAAKKLQSAQKRLMTLGLMKKPAVRRAPQQKVLTVGKPGTSIINVD